MKPEARVAQGSARRAITTAATAKSTAALRAMTSKDSHVSRSIPCPTLRAAAKSVSARGGSDNNLAAHQEGAPVADSESGVYPLATRLGHFG
jgi:hypothetical protein